MNSLQKLEKMFGQFPGIGPRQAKRFVHFILGKGNDYSAELTDLIQKIKKETAICTSCMRFFAKDGQKTELCDICKDETRDSSCLLIISHDIDLENIEKSYTYKGKYFVLGGSVPILEKDPEKRIRIKELLKKLKSDNTIKEIIMALNANPEGENTADFLKNAIKDLSKRLKISTLGRGLATGVELEYADQETLKNALKNRN